MIQTEYIPQQTEPGVNPEQAAMLPDLGSELHDRDMFSLHGIALDSVGGNSILPQETSLEERFGIAIKDKPMLSTVIHTDRATNSHAPLWSTVGVVVGGGKIEAVRPHDIGSVMTTGGKRQIAEQHLGGVSQALDEIAANDAKYPDYALSNEAVISDPNIAGLYFKDTAGLMPYEINRNQPTAPGNTVPELIRTLSAEYELPIFAIRTTGVYQVNQFDPATGQYEFSGETAPRVHGREVAARQNPQQQQTAAYAGTAAVHGYTP